MMGNLILLTHLTLIIHLVSLTLKTTESSKDRLHPIICQKKLNIYTNGASGVTSEI